VTQYMAVHTHTKSSAETWKVFDEGGPAMALAMKQGKTPAICRKTWEPHLPGKPEVAFSLWEAEKPEDVIATLGALNEYITTDLVPVEEIDWDELAEAAEAQTVK
jgi:hypothetical protein